LNRFTFEALLKNVRVGRRNSLVIVLFEIHDFKAELFVEFDSAFIVDLDVTAMERRKLVGVDLVFSASYSQEDVVEISVHFDELQDVIQKNAADAEPSVGREAAQGHDVQAPLVGRSVDPATRYRDRETMN
jgi:hypothetical protein